MARHAALDPLYSNVPSQRLLLQMCYFSSLDADDEDISVLEKDKLILPPLYVDPTELFSPMFAPLTSDKSVLNESETNNLSDASQSWSINVSLQLRSKGLDNLGNWNSEEIASLQHRISAWNMPQILAFFEWNTSNSSWKPKDVAALLTLLQSRELANCVLFNGVPYFLSQYSSQDHLPTEFCTMLTTALRYSALRHETDEMIADILKTLRWFEFGKVGVVAEAQVCVWAAARKND